MDFKEERKQMILNIGSRYSEISKKVLDAMKKKGKPVRPGEIAKDLGIESKQVSKAIQELKKEGKVQSPKQCFWEAV